MRRHFRGRLGRLVCEFAACSRVHLGLVNRQVADFVPDVSAQPTAIGFAIFGAILREKRNAIARVERKESISANCVARGYIAAELD